jgi:septal ring factor EnvC (AmiA/AmiB activator)
MSACCALSSELNRSLNVPEQLTDAETADKKDLRRLEESLLVLWEKARNVSEALLRLKTENKELQSRISSLESRDRRWAEELQNREKDLQEVRAQLAQAQSNGKSLFSTEESETLKLRLKELIGKINSRL